jgi:predicted dithiol-disulfide oxidoreductase (DUF899 family)
MPDVHAPARLDQRRRQTCRPARIAVHRDQVANRAPDRLGREHPWTHLEFLSTAENRYDADYFGDSSKVPAAIRRERGGKDGEHWDETMFNVFRLENGTVRHFWGSELAWAPMEACQHHRSGDAVNALWGLLDMTPEGRGQFMPKLVY